MNMKKWIVSTVTLTLTLGIAGSVTAFAFIGDGGGDDLGAPGPGGTVGEVSHGDPTYDDWLSDLGEGPFLNITGIGGVARPLPSETYGEVSPGFPTYDEWLSDFGGGKVVTSIDDIDPNVCNAIHNINACSPKELEGFGVAPTTGSIAVGESNPSTGEVGKPEPLFKDGEPGPIQITDLECSLDQWVYATSEGQTGCVDVIAEEEQRQVHDLIFPAI